MTAETCEVAVVVLSGYGPVGQALVNHLSSHNDSLAERHGVLIRVAAVRASTDEVRLRQDQPVPPREQWAAAGSLAVTLEETGARVLIQAVPSSPAARDDAARDALTALSRGVHVATATKSHLLSHWRELHDTAVANGSMVRISGATGAALPGGDLARVALRGMGCDSIRACPNGTVTYVLDRLSEGASLDAAVREAQRRGIAEADPTSDLSGADAATKARLLAALLWGWDPASVQVHAEPVDSSTARAAADAASRGRRLRAVASARREQPHHVHVRLEDTVPGDPLHALIGPEKAVAFGCPEAGDITVSGGRSSPLGAALALIKDTIGLTAPTAGFN